MLKPNILKTAFNILVIYFLIISPGYSQKATGSLETLITIHLDQTTTDKVFASISDQTGLSFSYSPTIINTDHIVNCHADQKPVRYVLNSLLSSDITIKQRGKYILLVKNKPGDQTDKVYIEGYITEPITGKGLGEVTVYNKEMKASAVTNKYGYFKIELKPLQPITELRVCKSGFDDTTIVRPLKPGFVDINLQQAKKTSKIDLIQEWIPKFPVWLVSREMLINAINIKNDSIFEKFQVSFLPFVGTNQLLGGTAVNDYSFNVFAGYTQSVKVLEVGGMFNFVRWDAGNCQLAGMGNIVGGSTYGFQGAGFYNISRENKGLQMAGFFNVGFYDGGIGQLAGFGNFTWGKVRGVQAGGYFNIARQVKGIQLAGFVNYAQKLNGIQVSGFNNYAKTGTGMQITGALNISQSYSRSQVSGFINIADTVELTQIAGFFNYAKQLDGFQLSGWMNIAKNVEGTQIGIINFADSCPGIPIGLISIVKKGYHRFEISSDELINLNLSYKMGVPRFYNIFSAGIRPGNNDLVSFGYGFGSLLGKGPKRRFNLEITQNSLDEAKSLQFKNQLTRFYFGIDRNISQRVSVNYGISVNVFETDETDQNRINTMKKNIPYTILKPDIDTKIWLGARLGLRF